MIISPPFLSQPNVPVYDEQCVRDVMPGGVVGSGAFPVSQAMAWHGGIHIHAPTADEPVRAIADGTVIFSRAAGNARYDGQDNSTGCVVIRHKTEIGATGTTPVEVVFYSIYQHLRQLAANLPAVGQPVYRKDALGLAGIIYGQVNRIHLEIVAGDADTAKLVGRSTGNLVVTSDGRVDAVYGQVYVLVPTQTACYGTQPTGATLPATTGGSGAADLIVGLKYEAGSATLTTYQLSGEVVGAAPTETDAEYNRYTEANTRHNRTPAGSSPSGWYELLRFGRNLGSDPLPNAAAHWRKVVLPGQPQGAWINLNAADTKKFSDADFPHWMGWKLVEDDIQDDNSQCNSALIDAMLGPAAQPPAPPSGAPNLTSPPVPAPQAPENAATTPEQKAANRMQNLCKPAVQAKLAKTICKFPTEWAKDEVRKRWAWTRDKGNPYMPYPLEDESDFTEMADFAQKLCFWEELPAEDKARLTIKHWHLHPREFIKHFRKCGWLSKDELTQLFPMEALRNAGAKGWVSEGVIPNRGRIASNLIALNKATRKYGITTPQRLAAFYGNAMQETQWFGLLAEGDGTTARYAPWYGRGFLQLTWPDNYVKYWSFRGRVVSQQLASQLSGAAAQTNLPPRNNAPLQALEALLPAGMSDWRNDLRADGTPSDASDSSGAYWAWSEAARNADLQAPFVRAAQVSSGRAVYYTHSGFGAVAATVNVGRPSTNYAIINGVQARFQAYTSAMVVLAESLQFPTATGQTQDTPEGWRRRLP